MIYIAMEFLDRVAAGAQHLRQVPRDEHAAVPPAGASDRDGQIGFALPHVVGEQVIDEAEIILEESGREGLIEQIMPDPGIQAGQTPEPRDVVGVGQKAHIHDDVRIQRQTVFIAK